MLNYPASPRVSASRPLSLLMALVVVVSSIVVAQPLTYVPSLPAPAPAAPAAPPSDPARQPLSFVPNAGQADPAVRLQVQALGGTIFFTPGELVLSLPTPQPNQATMSLPRAEVPGLPSTTSAKNGVQAPPTVVRVSWDGANPTPKIAGATKLPGVVNYFRGNDPAQWRTNVPTYAGVEYTSLYPGIDLHYDGLGGVLKGTYHVAAGVDPALIRWRYDGAAHPVVDATGALNLQVGAATLTEQPPVAWQDIDGQRRDVAIRYTVAADGSVGFALGDYDPAHALTLDPELVYSTYWSGGPTDVATDSAGNVYIAGYTVLEDMIVGNPLQPTCAIGGEYNLCVDAFITKFGPNGSVIYSTYWGGRGFENQSEPSIAVDALGNAYVSGNTNSADFPLRNALQSSCIRHPEDESVCASQLTFLSKFTPGGAIVFSTFWGGSTFQENLDIAINAAGNVLITGRTDSADFPIKNAFQPTGGRSNGTGSMDGYVSKFTSGGAVLYSTYLGGSGDDYGYALATDEAGNAYITGHTDSRDFPKRNAIRSTCDGLDNWPLCYGVGFVTKLTSTGALAYSTYLGGSSVAYDIVADAAGNTYVSGEVDTDDFPVTNRVLCATTPCHGSFVMSLTSDGALRRSTIFSRVAWDSIHSLALDARGQLFAGFDHHAPVPGQKPAGATCVPADDLFDCFENTGVMQLTDTGTFVSVTTVGGSEYDSGRAIAIDSTGNIVVVGGTQSRDLPLRNAVQPTCYVQNNVCVAGFVAKIRMSNLAISAKVDRPAVATTDLVMATVVVTNTDIKATPAVTLTLTEGGGMLHAPDSDDSFGRNETVDGLNNVVHFDSGSFAPGEQKTFKVPLMATPEYITDTAEVQVVRSTFGAVNAAGDTARTEVAINVTGLQNVWDNAPPFDRLPGLPVGDIGTTPDAPFNPGGITPLAFKPMQGGNPSITGNLWDFYLNGSITKWSKKDQILFKLLTTPTKTKNGTTYVLTNRDAYAIIYLKALIGMAPSKPTLPGWIELRKAAWKLWRGIEKAKKTTLTPEQKQAGIKDAFKDAMGALDTVNAQYFTSLLEFHEGYTQPAVSAVQDRFRSFALDDRDIQRLIYAYYNGDISKFDFERQMPFSSLVRYDVSYWLAYRSYPRAVHVKLLSQVPIKRHNASGTRNLALVIDELLKGDTPEGFAGPIPAALMPQWVGVQVHSPLLPLITDAQGRRAGVDARTGVVYDEIPGSIITPGHPWKLAIPAASETLRVEWTTAYPYAFGIDVQGLYKGTVTSQQSFSGTATDGYVAKQTIQITKNTTSVVVRASPLDPPPTNGSKVYLPAIRR